jgi:hypothetical protein
LTENEFSEWVLRKSLNPNASKHNHHLSDLIWPPQIHDRIVQLARQKSISDDEIRDTIKLQFPDVIWDDRRFLDNLKMERKRIRQKGVTERVQRLIMASTRLCSVVAANEDWASCVEGDLAKMLESYRQLTRVPNHTLETMVDLELDMIHSEIDKSRRQSRGDENDMVATKKRKASFIAAAASRENEQDQSVQIMSVPNYTLFIRSQPLRSLSEPSSQNRRAFNDLIATSASVSSASSIHHQQQQQQQQQQHHMAATTPFGVSTVFNLTSPVSSSSSTSSIQQRMDYGNATYSRNNNANNNDMLQSPPIPDPGMMIAPNYGSSTSGNSNSSATGHHHHHHHPTNTSYNSNLYPIQTSFPAYSSSATGDMNFSFDANTMATTPTYHQSRVPSSSAPIMVHRQSSSVTAERITGYPTSMNYYNTTSTIGGGRDASSNTSIQQRLMLQQEYEQQRRQLQQLDSNGNVHLPIIRSNNTTGVIPTTNQLVQHQQAHSNINHQQSWS